MASIRRPAVAGMFYPDDASELQQQLDEMLAHAKQQVAETANQIFSDTTRAIVVPHAGYIYSGEIAASAYQGIINIHNRIERVVLLGPSHRHGFHGLAVTESDYYETPLGLVPLDKKAAEQLVNNQQAQYVEQAHAHEHSLEVQIPFLQTILDEFILLPIVVGDSSATQINQVLEAYWDATNTLIVISSDLSHYHDYITAQRLDHDTCHAIEACNYEDIGYDQACGRMPLSGLLYCARNHKASVTTIDLRNSGDTAGDKMRVVGYGSWVVNDTSALASNVST